MEESTVSYNGYRPLEINNWGGGEGHEITYRHSTKKRDQIFFLLLRVCVSYSFPHIYPTLSSMPPTYPCPTSKPFDLEPLNLILLCCMQQ